MAEKDSKNASSEWQLNGSHQSSVMMEQPSCSNANKIESFRPAIWDQLPGSDHLGFSDNTLRLNPDPYNALMNQACLGWTPPDAMLKGGMFLPGCPGFLPPSLAHFPADSGFIERAARYSCFSGGKLGEIVNPFSLPESVNPSALAPMLGVQSRNDNMNMVGSSNGVYVPAQCVVSAGNQFRNVKSNESLARSHDEVKGGVGVSSNASDEVSGQGTQEKSEALGRESSSKAHGSKKRNRCYQQVVEVRKDNNGDQRIGPQTPASISNKPGGKNAKQGPEASDLPKEEYIHVRARRGQATNSHSLAERVRREKISERMKFLQELVPGCSKVTGKAVMFDAIINYVQSLQRQVEFLSMKLATVNPRLDFNIEELLAKDSQAGPSAQAFPPDISMPYPPLHQ